MRHVESVALAAGPLVLFGYLLGSGVYAWLRRDGLPRGGRRPGWHGVAEAASGLAAAVIALRVTRWVAPGTETSAVGALSSQVLTAWQSIALWSGMAAVVGHVAPVWRRFDGGSGLPPALALTLVYAPVVFAASVAGFFAGFALTGRPRGGIPVALGTAVVGAWLGWVWDWPAGWGLHNGPELALWSAVGATLLAAAWWRDAGRGSAAGEVQ